MIRCSSGVCWLQPDHTHLTKSGKQHGTNTTFQLVYKCLCVGQIPSGLLWERNILWPGPDRQPGLSDAAQWQTDFPRYGKVESYKYHFRATVHIINPAMHWCTVKNCNIYCILPHSSIDCTVLFFYFQESTGSSISCMERSAFEKRPRCSSPSWRPRLPPAASGWPCWLMPCHYWSKKRSAIIRWFTLTLINSLSFAGI